MASRTIRTARGKMLPDHPHFNGNVLRAVEAEWLHYAIGPDSEKLCARWVEVPMAGGKKHLQLQKDDGRGHAKRPNANRDPSGYYLLNALDGKPSILILTVQDMAEAVYRHWLARGEDEKTQDVFCRRFGNKYEGTRIEDINWIIRKIKIRTKEAEQGLLASYYNTPSSNASQPTATAGLSRVQNSSQPRVTIDLSSPTATRLPHRSTPSTTDRIAQAVQSQSQRDATSNPVRTATNLGNNAASSSHTQEHSLSASRKRLNTQSRDFSERESRRLRVSLAEHAILSGDTTTQPGHQTLTPLIAANSSARRADLATDRVSTSTSYTGTARNVKTDLGSPSRSTTGKGSHNVSGSATMSKSAKDSKRSTSRFTGASTSSASVGKKVHTADIAGSSKIFKKSESLEGVALSPSLPNRSARQDKTTRKTNDDSGRGKKIKADPGKYGGSMGTSSSGKQACGGVSDIFGGISAGNSSGSNTEGSGSAGYMAPPVHGSTIRKQSVIAGSSTGSPLKVIQGSSKGSTAVMGGSSMKVNKGYGSVAAKPVASPMTPVNPAGHSKPVSDNRHGSGPPKFCNSQPAPMRPRSNLANTSSYGPGGRSTPNGSRHGFQPRWNHWKREPDMGQYEKTVDSTAHLYKSAPEPEKYSEEWQNSRLGLGLASEHKETVGPAVKKELTSPTPSPAAKTSTKDQNGLIGVLNVISDWSSGNGCSKTGASTGTPTRQFSRPLASSSNTTTATVKANSKDASGYQGLGFPNGNRNFVGSGTYTGSSARNTPIKSSSGFDTSTRTPTASSASFDRSGSGYNPLPPKPVLPISSSSPLFINTPSTGPRNFPNPTENTSNIGTSRIGTTPPTGPAGWNNSAPSTNHRGSGAGSRRVSPGSGSSGGDSYRPVYDDNRGPPPSYDPSNRARRDDYHDAVRSGYAPGSSASYDHRSFDYPRSGRRSPQFDDYPARPQSRYDDQYSDARRRY